MADETPVVFSARETEWFTPPGSPRSYLLQPLTYRERSAMRRELRRVGGIAPERAALLEGMREALRQVQPANLDACLHKAERGKVHDGRGAIFAEDLIETGTIQ